MRLHRRAAPASVPSAELVDAVAGVAAWSWLHDDDRARLLDDAAVLEARFRWEAAKGFTLTPQIRATIAAHAALLTLRLGTDCYRKVSTVIVHPSVFHRQGEHLVASGIVSDDALPLLGEARFDGPVLIAWDEASNQARHPERGHNVIYHEFAHRLDMLDGWVDGTPPLPDPETRDRWIKVCTDAFERLRHGDDAHGVLDGYGATNPGEFFAVVTEVFFARPDALHKRRPELYRVFADFYRIDPLEERRTA